MRRWSLASVVGVLVALLATSMLAVGSAAARNLQPLGPAPVPCTTGVDTNCTFNSRCAQMSFSPHLVHVDEDIVSSAGPAVDACGPGGTAAISWGWGAYDGLSYVRPCPEKASECRFKATSPTLVTPAGSNTPKPGYQIGCIDGGSGFGSWMSCDFYGVIGSRERAIDGRVLTKRGKPVVGAEISIDGPTGGSVHTDANGDFYAIVDAGQYRVSVQGVRDTVAFCSGGQHGSVCDLDLNHNDGQADFTAPPDTIAFHFTPASITADGVNHFDGTIDVTNSAGAPAPGTDVKVSPPLDATPLGLVCSEGKVVYPQLLSDKSALGSPFTVTTDANGQVPLTLWAGTVPGHWFTQGEEAADSSVSTAVTFSFESGGAARFPSVDELPLDFYDAVRATHNSPSLGAVVMQLNKLFTAEGENQDFILQWLIAAGRESFPGADFGPVNYGGHAGILFYPRGSTNPTGGPTAVLDVRDAVELLNAAAGGQPIPTANNVARTLSDWAMYVSGSHTAPPLNQTLGPLAVWTGDQYAYFGFPYPRSALDIPGQVKFYNSCAAPDGTPQIVQTHSPVTLVFHAASGVSFGLDASGTPTGAGTGIIFRKGDQTTYVVPAGRYSTMTVTGTRNGKAHVEVFGVVGSVSTTYARQISNYAFNTRAGTAGALSLNFFGPAGAFLYGGGTVKQQLGLPLTLAGVPSRLRHGKRTFKVTVTSLATAIAGATVTLRYKGHTVQSTTDSRGHARLRAKLPAGKLTISVSFPGAATARVSVRVR